MQLIRQISLFFLLTVVLMVLVNLWIYMSTYSRVHNEVASLPERKVALVLGTSKYSRGGGVNPFFRNRIKAAAELYKLGKVKHILVSGDNKTRSYNEPINMQKELTALGVPETSITMDYAGFRTLDSIVRCKEVFGQSDIIIVTQRFHNYRALFIGDHYELNSVGFAAEGIPFNHSFRVELREFFARVKAAIDIYLLKTEPKFLGEEEKIEFDLN